MSDINKTSTHTHFVAKPFSPPFYLKNPHLQTILPKFVRQPKPKYWRELHLDSTGRAYVAYDFVGRGQATDLPLVVLFHGLEGSSDSHYAKSLANYAVQMGRLAVVVHYRGCGGVENHANVDYHAGDIGEIHHVLTRLNKIYPKIVAVGVSLGGNMLAKYLGEYRDKAVCMAGVVVSAPVDLTSSAKVMHKFVARHVYTPYLLKSLLKKTKNKFDDKINIKKIKTLDAFDDIYTAPRHGYGVAQNYYKQASALPQMYAITKPTLVIASQDDPFLGTVASHQDISAKVQLLYSPHGGHVGFVDMVDNRLHLGWLAKTTFDFFDWVEAVQ